MSIFRSFLFLFLLVSTCAFTQDFKRISLSGQAAYYDNIQYSLSGQLAYFIDRNIGVGINCSQLNIIKFGRSSSDGNQFSTNSYYNQSFSWENKTTINQQGIFAGYKFFPYSSISVFPAISYNRNVLSNQIEVDNHPIITETLDPLLNYSLIYSSIGISISAFIKINKHVNLVLYFGTNDINFNNPAGTYHVTDITATDGLLSSIEISEVPLNKPMYGLGLNIKLWNAKL